MIAHLNGTVTEKDIKPNNAYSENNSFYEELMNIKKEIHK